MSQDRVTTGSFINVRGVTLKTKIWHPSGDPIALVVFLHGLNVNTTSNEAWQRVADVHTAAGILCVGLDYEGHGSSGGDWRNIQHDLQLLVDDVLQFVLNLNSSHSGLQIFLRGQSMGGLVALAAALKQPDLFKGLALGAPAYQLPWLVRNTFAPQAIIAGGEYVKEHLNKLTVPFAVFQGVEDKTVDPAGARHLLEGAGSADKSLYLYKDMGHNMSMEPDVLNWLLPRISGKTSVGSTLYVRRPVPGLKWQPPPAGSSEANANTNLEVVIDQDEQKRLLDDLIAQQVSSIEVIGSYVRMLPRYGSSLLPLAFRR